MLRRGERIRERYVIVRGPREDRSLAGGMGWVYLCEDEADDRSPVALKTLHRVVRGLHSNDAGRDDARDGWVRFLREAETWVRLGRHPHIVHARQAVRLPHVNDIYLVLDWIPAAEGKPGASLHAWLSGRPVEAERALTWALHIARGMRYATSVIPGLVHRDLKPKNVLVGRDELARVTDFGLVRVTDAADGADSDSALSWTANYANLTDRQALGTPAYMAPEQWKAASVDHRADMYALGCIVIELFTGRPAVSTWVAQEARDFHCAGGAFAATKDVPSEVRSWLRGCLAVEPSRRYITWDALVAALEALFRAVVQRSAPEELTSGESVRLDQVASGWSHNAVGLSYADISNFELAAASFRRAATIGIATGDRELEGAALANGGIAHLRLDDPRAAVSFHEKSLEIARSIGHRRNEGNALGNLGNVYFAIGDTRRAIEFHTRHLAIARELRDSASELTALQNLTNCYVNLNEYSMAIRGYEEVIGIAKQLHDRRVEAAAIGSLANVYSWLGETERAIALGQHALTITREALDRASEVRALANLGRAYSDKGDPSQALAHLDHGIRLAREIRMHQAVGVMLNNVGTIVKEQGDLVGARLHYEQSLEIAEACGDKLQQSRSLANLADIAIDLGQRPQAVELLRRSLDLATGVGNRGEVAMSSMTLASLLMETVEHRAAVAYATTAANLFRELGRLDEAAEAERIIDHRKTKNTNE